ncbi:unnamed protein product [Cuscuta epithymum]|uniref:Uncharacterized protein n=1 Tax=Cuscuta epithymum TaxID=186058 RepID=A0AAV0F8Y3_9ASTE|nr:unnamed protein product [Cuscuta epithymum]
MDFQHLHGYNRPPPPPPLPSMADPHYPPPPPQSQRPPSLPPSSWHPSQFQYHPPPQHSPSHPPPPPPYQWSAPPPPYHAPYPSHHFPQNHYPHPPAARPNLPPPLPQSHHHTNQQDLGSTNWGHHQTSDYSAHTKEEDWAAKAREWAAAKAASDNQQPPLTQSGRHEEPNHYYYDRYPQSADPHFQDSQQERVWTPSYQQFTDSVAAPSQNVPIGHSQKSSYIHHDEHLSYTDRDGSLAGDPTSALPQQGNLSVSPLVHWPEVPSSYSSIGGEEVAGNRQNDRLYNSHSLSVTSGVQHNVKPLPPPPPVGPLSTMTEEPHHSYGGHFTEAINLMDKPLEFAPHVNRHHGLHVQSNHSHSDSVGSSNGVDPVSRMTSTYAWPPAAIGVEPAMVVPSPVFGRLPAPNFHSTVPTVNPTFGYSSGAAGVTTSVTFPADSYAMPSDRPKKASVPNWLREEIIKKKAVITSSVPDLQRDDDLEDEDVNKPYRRGDQVDTKSIESSRSTEEEDDDEDDVDAARTAAINVEIKRVLTEVLLKVTDELFDEIATKVLSEDSPILEVTAESDATLTGNKLSSSARAVSTPKASAKVLIPFKIREDSGDGNKHSASASPGNVLGLANYASDDDDDDDDNDEIQSNVKTIPDKDSLAQQSVAINQAEGKILVENGSSLDKIEKKGGLSENVENAMKMSPNSSTTSIDKVGRQPSDDKEAMELVHGNSRLPSKSKSGVLEETLAVEVAVATEGINRDFDNKKRKLDSSHIRESQNKSDNNCKAKNKDIDNIKDKLDDGDHKRRERYVKNDQTSDDKKDQVKDNKIFKSVEKENEQDTRKKASVDTTESKGKTDRESRSSGKGDITRTEKGKDEKREKLRRRGEIDSGKHRRRRSSSIGSRGRENKDNLVSYPTDSNDESSDDYKRKPYSRRRRSPSPIRARKRQVSRSPRSKHSHQRRHSPYPSLETTRSRRSRSRSPIRRKR